MRTSKIDNMLQQLLSTVGSKTSSEHTLVEVKPFDWKRPRYFKAVEMNQLESLIKNIEQSASDKLTSFFRCEYKVTLKSLNQRYGREDINSKSKDIYCLGFGPDAEHLHGVLKVPSATAKACISIILGESGADEGEKKMTQLEESLIMDIGTVLIKVFCSSHKSLNWTPAKKIAFDLCPAGLQANDEICEIVFNLQKASSDLSYQATIIVMCNKLDALVGKAAVENKVSPADVSKAMIGYLQNIDIPAQIILDSTTLSLEDAMMLQEGDILLLDKKINHGADLFVQGVNLYQGRLAKSKNKRAFVVTGLPQKKDETI